MRLPDAPVTGEQWAAAVGTCSPEPREQRDAALLWLGWSLALSVPDALALRHEHAELGGIRLARSGSLIAMRGGALETVASVVRAGLEAAARASGSVRGGGWGIGPARVAQVADALLRRAGRPGGASWSAVRAGGLLWHLRVSGWAAAAHLAQCVGLDLGATVSLQSSSSAELVAVPMTTAGPCVAVAAGFYEGHSP